MREFATKLNINPDTEFIAWRDDCLAHDRRYSDWTAAWRTRCRNHVKFATGGRSISAAPQRPLTDADEYIRQMKAAK
jgi:hypothetical protein